VTLRERVGRMIKAAADRLLDGETPPPPMRLSEQVVAFASMNPAATRGEWSEFAIKLATGASREGFRRGAEWTERELARLPADDPARVEEAGQYDYPWHAPGHLTDTELQEVVVGDFFEKLPDDAQKARYLDAVGQYDGSFRVVILPPDKRGGAPPVAPG